MKIKEYLKIHRKKAAITIASLVIMLVAAGGAAFFFWWKNQGKNPFSQGNFMPEDITFGGDMVSASGITSVGVTQENFEVEGLEEGLVVEEVYASSGDELIKGDKILKLSEESVQNAREELEKALREAQLAYRTGAIEYEQNKITAGYERDMAVLKGRQAKEVYSETVESLKEGVERAQKQLDETQEKISEYEEILDGNDSYETYKVGEYQALYDDNLKLLTTRMEEWGASWNQVTSGAGPSSAGGTTVGKDGLDNNSRTLTNENAVSVSSVSGSDAVTATSDQLSVLQSLYRVLEQNLKDYEQAKEDYEDAAVNAELELQTLQLSLSSLQEALSQAEADYDTQVLQAKLTMEKALTAAERADSDYETAMEKAESDYESLKEAAEEAEENLALFEECVGDGYYHAADSGTVLRVMIGEEQNLKSNEAIFLYSNPGKMTVVVSVDQGDISSIEVGEGAYVISAEYGRFQGTVTRIDPVSQSEGRTNVTYNVIVTLTKDAGKLQTNETVTVIFGAEI